MYIIDLSYDIENSMPVYPGDSKVKMVKKKSYSKDGYTSYILNSCMHVGTHIDAPMHLTEDGNYISSIDINNFFGEGIVLDVRGEDRISYRAEYENLLHNKKIVLLYTGFEKYYGSSRYYNDHPVLEEELINLFIKNNIKVIGMDMPSPDKFPFNIHRKILSNNICILENLRNLEKLLFIENFKVSSLPLKIMAEASLVRAVAIIDN